MNSVLRVQINNANEWSVLVFFGNWGTKPYSTSFCANSNVFKVSRDETIFNAQNHHKLSIIHRWYIIDVETLNRNHNTQHEHEEGSRAPISTECQTGSLLKIVKLYWENRTHRLFWLPGFITIRIWKIVRFINLHFLFKRLNVISTYYYFRRKLCWCGLLHKQ